MMKKNVDPNSQGYTNVLLEDINDKFQVLIEEQSSLSARVDRNTDLLHTTFEEVGRLRIDADALKIGFIDLKEEVGDLKVDVKELTKEVRDNKVRVDRFNRTNDSQQ